MEKMQLEEGDDGSRDESAVVEDEDEAEGRRSSSRKGKERQTGKPIQRHTQPHFNTSHQKPTTPIPPKTTKTKIHNKSLRGVDGRLCYSRRVG